MLHFFRKIRHKLLTDNRFSKYLLYAIGEISLVVIGILIALQVDNWNEERKTAEQEQQILQALHAEIELNKATLGECLQGIQESLDTTRILRTYLGPEHAGLTNKRILELLTASSYVPTCNVVTDVLEELRSSGNLQVIQDREIRQAISRWSGAHRNLQTEEAKWGQDFATQYIPYTNKWISWDDYDYYIYAEDSTTISSPFEYDANEILQQFEFANILNTMSWRMNREKFFLRQLDNQTRTLDSLIAKALE